ncbi:hypothetical protein LMG28614_06516 [Paraburkholderia ultramafica]|uniref:Uncharacterized protein n=1 Tax=Paraburkholderia ultramafica TaxID=1544867 RepID=A0A6S7BPV7_9BURK|nr:hypothetical protein LMG28614_06516 [Paraburkholderia ultramafica]
MAGQIAVPPLACTALDRYWWNATRLLVTPTRWHPDTPLVGSLGEDSTAGIRGVRLGTQRGDTLRKWPKSSTRTTRRSRRSCAGRRKAP